MGKILPPSRPKRDNAAIDAVIEHYQLDKTLAALIFVRGYYLDSMGKPGANDQNVYDDAIYLVTPSIRESYNANTEPSVPRKNGRDMATLNLGRYRYYKGKHKNKYAALRPFPEGVVLQCMRAGKASTCSHTNIHKGGSRASFDVVWSEGCLTIPDIQYDDFQTRVYAEMIRLGQKTIDVVIVENRQTEHGQQLFDEHGRVI